jgi:hypothetical protein
MAYHNVVMCWKPEKRKPKQKKRNADSLKSPEGRQKTNTTPQTDMTRCKAKTNSEQW